MKIKNHEKREDIKIWSCQGKFRSTKFYKKLKEFFTYHYGRYNDPIDYFLRFGVSSNEKGKKLGTMKGSYQVATRAKVDKVVAIALGGFV